MWWPAKSSGVISVEPVELVDARRQCRIGPTDTSFDPEITRLIKVARDHVEKYCGMQFATRELTLECTDWSDMARLPFAPLAEITSIKYRDDAGDQQTLPDSVYEQGGDRFTPAIRLKLGQSWPVAMEHGANIELVATFGGEVPPSVQHAMLMLIAHLFVVRESVNVGNIVSAVPMAFDDLLVNDRRYS